MLIARPGAPFASCRLAPELNKNLDIPRPVVEGFAHKVRNDSPALNVALCLCPLQHSCPILQADSWHLVVGLLPELQASVMGAAWEQAGICLGTSYSFNHGRAVSAELPAFMHLLVERCWQWEPSLRLHLSDMLQSLSFLHSRPSLWVGGPRCQLVQCIAIEFRAFDSPSAAALVAIACLVLHEQLMRAVNLSRVGHTACLPAAVLQPAPASGRARRVPGPAGRPGAFAAQLPTGVLPGPVQPGWAEQCAAGAAGASALVKPLPAAGSASEAAAVSRRTLACIAGPTAEMPLPCGAPLPGPRGCLSQRGIV
jgi:hypothetical protein